MSDLSEQPIYIIDGESAPAASIPACGVGIESTVIKIDEALSKVLTLELSREDLFLVATFFISCRWFCFVKVASRKLPSARWWNPLASAALKCISVIGIVVRAVVEGAGDVMLALSSQGGCENRRGSAGSTRPARDTLRP